jgi:hypothetical protein
MTTKAIISCDYEPCEVHEAFRPTASPPPRWYVLRHPVTKRHGSTPVLCDGTSTFCSAEHLASWAAERAEAGEPSGEVRRG